MLPSLLLLALGQSSLKQPVDYSTTGASAAAIIRDLSQKTGVKLESTADAETAYMILHSANRPLEQVMQRIAAATSSRWETADGVTRLVPDLPLRRREEEALAKSRLDSYQTILKDIEEYIKLLEEDDSGEEDEYYQIELGQHKTWLAIFRALDARSLAALKPGERVVYSSRPTRMQKPLPAISSHLGPFIEVINSSEGEEMGYVFEDNSPELQKMRELAAKYEYGYNYRPGTVAKVLVIAEASVYNPALFPAIQVHMYDAQGRNLGQFVSEYGDMSYEGYAVDGEETDPITAALEADVERAGKAVPDPKMPEWWKEIADEASREYREMEADSTIPSRPFSAEVMERVLHPVKHDPMGLLVGEVLVAFGRAIDRPLAVVIPDTQQVFTSTREPWPMILDWLAYEPALALAYQDGWLTVNPRFPSVHRSETLNRAALEKLLGEVDDQGGVTYDALADFAKEVPYNTSQGYLMQIALDTFLRGTGITYTWVQDADMGWNSLRLYGHLSPGQREQLKRGGQVSISSLGAGGRAVANEMIYGPDAAIGRAEEADRKEFVAAYGQYAFEYMIGSFVMYGDYRDEPTEAAGNGMNPNAYITAEVRKFPIIAPGQLQGDKFVWDKLSTFEEYAEESMGESSRPPSLFMMLGEREEMVMTIHFAPRVSPTYTLRSNKITDTQVRHLSQLPESHKALYEKARKTVDLLRRVYD